MGNAGVERIKADWRFDIQNRWAAANHRVLALALRRFETSRGKAETTDGCQPIPAQSASLPTIISVLKEGLDGSDCYKDDRHMPKLNRAKLRNNAILILVS